MTLFFVVVPHQNYEASSTRIHAPTSNSNKVLLNSNSTLNPIMDNLSKLPWSCHSSLEASNPVISELRKSFTESSYPSESILEPSKYHRYLENLLNHIPAYLAAKQYNCASCGHEVDIGGSGIVCGHANVLLCAICHSLVI